MTFASWCGRELGAGIDLDRCAVGGDPGLRRHIGKQSDCSHNFTLRFGQPMRSTSLWRSMLNPVPSSLTITAFAAPLPRLGSPYCLDGKAGRKNEGEIDHVVSCIRAPVLSRPSRAQDYRAAF